IVLKEPLAQTRQRKSVVFSEGATIVDSNGEVTEVNGHSDKASAENHTKDATETTDKSVDEVTDLFKGLVKKKKSKKPKDTEGAGGDGAAPAADGEFDATALKKKKKKKAPKAADGDDFDAKLAEAGVNEDEEGANGAAQEAPIEEGDLEKGTGIWHHNATQPISYPLLLTRFFTLLHNHHPDLLSSGSKSYKIPPPQCLREGNKKTIFANIADICKRIKRTDEHVTLFLFSELGTSGSVDGSRRLVIKGRFQQKQIENVLRRYIGEHIKTFRKRLRGLIHPSR
ncbi:MAG: hypothetical protein Q9214_007659, partial [Letrouitia sp. 1 TL-2023]